MRLFGKELPFAGQLFSGIFLKRFIIHIVFSYAALLFCHDLAAASLLTSPSSRNAKLMGGALEVTGYHWNCGMGCFAGLVHAENKLSEPTSVSIVVKYNSSVFYRKTVNVPAGKAVQFPVYPPLTGGERWRNYYVSIRDKHGDEVSWTSYGRNYSHTPKDIPLVIPKRASMLSDNYRAYLGISTLRLKTEQWRKMSASEKNAALEWVQLGGSMEISGENDARSAILEKYPPMNFCSSWKNSSGSYGGGHLKSKAAFAEDHGSGSPLILTDNSFSQSPSWKVRLISAGLFIPALLIFAFLIGPSTIIYSRRKKNPALILALIPAISIASCLAILILSLLNDGITPKVCRQIATYLDQTRNRALTNQMTGIEAPLGLREPVVFPECAIVTLSESSSMAGGNCVAEGGKIKLHSFASARVPTFFKSCKYETRREKLEVMEDASSVTVTNGLGGAVESLILKDSSGRLWQSNAPVPAGGEAKLSKLDSLKSVKQYALYQTFIPSSGDVRREGNLDRCCYQAYLKSNIFGDNGIDSTRVVGNNFFMLVGRYK